MNNRRWRITTVVPLPKLVIAVEPPEPGSFFPKKIGFQSRVINKHVVDVAELGKVALAPNPYELLQAPPESNCDLGIIFFETDSSTAELALSGIASNLELLLDDISFQLQFAV